VRSEGCVYRSRRGHQYGGRYRCVDTSPTLADCLFTCGLSCSRNTTDSQLLAMVSIVRLLRRCVLGADVTGACDVVSVTRPSHCTRLPQEHIQ
jgi:hypothetical protein